MEAKDFENLIDGEFSEVAGDPAEPVDLGIPGSSLTGELLKRSTPYTEEELRKTLWYNHVEELNITLYPIHLEATHEESLSSICSSKAVPEGPTYLVFPRQASATASVLCAEAMSIAAAAIEKNPEVDKGLVVMPSVYEAMRRLLSGRVIRPATFLRPAGIRLDEDTTVEIKVVATKEEEDMENFTFAVETSPGEVLKFFLSKLDPLTPESIERFLRLNPMLTGSI